ncbi:MAG: SDR family NAD(P)-dependent oxidoreductase [Flavitalea sp.]
MKQIALVTGATSGFGKAIAHKFAENGYSVIITGRRKELLDELSKTIEAAYSVKVLSLNFDVRDRAAVQQAFQSIPESWNSIDVLVNNAGLAAGRDYFDEASMDDWENMIDTNLKGLLYVSKAALPFLMNSKKRHIINIGSTAAKEVYEKGNVYCASKHAVDAISKAMRIDMLRHRIKVTAVHPGAAETEFSMVRFKGDQKMADSIYAGYTPLYAEDIAEVVYYSTTLPEHVCINDLVITSLAQANSLYLYKG